MEFKDEELRELIAILKKVFPGERFTLPEAEAIAQRMMTLYGELAKPLPRESQKREIHGD